MEGVPQNRHVQCRIGGRSVRQHFGERICRICITCDKGFSRTSIHKPWFMLQGADRDAWRTRFRIMQDGGARLGEVANLAGELRVGPSRL